MERATAVVCGAGIGGLSAAHELAVRRGLAGVVVVDPLPPLSLTSDKSTECYRNWWPGPGPTMVRLMNRSIDRLEELERTSGGRLALNRAGYLYLTAEPETARALERQAGEIAALGAGPLRLHCAGADEAAYPPFRAAGCDPALDGADLLLDPPRIRRLFPGLAADTVAALHARRCGWLSAQQLGMELLERAREAGVRLLAGRVVAVDVWRGAVRAVEVETVEGRRERIRTDLLVDAAGPFAGEVARLAGVELPLACELHGKVFFDDHLGVVPRDLPLSIWCDPVELAWSAEERAGLAADPALAPLLRPLPAGVHFRPEGGRDSTFLLLLWTYHLEPVAPVFPPRFDPTYPEVALRGLARVIPAAAVYLERGMRRPRVDGGYYCKTRENRPLVGPTPVAGFHLFCGLSGYGIMASQGLAELLGAWVAGGPRPAGADEFLLARYDDPAYVARLDAMASGQL